MKHCKSLFTEWCYPRYLQVAQNDILERNMWLTHFTKNCIELLCFTVSIVFLIFENICFHILLY